MKGLLLKDFYLLWRYYKFFIIIMLAIMGLSFLFISPFFLAYPIFFISVIVIGLTSMEERGRWQLYTAALPCSRKTIVLEKYLLAAILLTAMTVICLLVALFIPFELSIIFLNLCGAILILSLFLPIQLRFGAERARIFYLLMVALVFGGFSALNGAVADGYSLSLPQSPAFWFIAFGVFTILFTLLSMLISIKVYQRKELA